ncbi:MAG: enoyl-CoA hydratase/isomerase family protein [Candidatus Nitrosocosmicus sp.]|nr:enoyl-CoA hydratase/isomerase family protein [Candidatus Nitrosocosmicus sp.]
MPNTRYIITEQRENTRIIKINRPEVYNAINFDLVTELKQEISLCETNEKICAVILTGEGLNSFSAGGDLKNVIKMSPNDAIQYANHVHELLNLIEGLAKPVLAAINGFALGGGCQIALACDLRIASSNAKIGQPEVKIGISPGWGGTQRLSRIVGISKAKELIYTGKIIDANEAYNIKLINKIVRLNDDEKQNDNPIAENSILLKEKLLRECVSIAESINNGYPMVTKTCKVLINKARDADSDTGLLLEYLAFRYCLSDLIKNRQDLMGK